MNERSIFINGKPLQTQADSLHALLLERGFSLGAAFACAVNNSFVPRAHWPQHTLQAGDRVDVIAPITGG
jgi:sulfur carrier protein